MMLLAATACEDAVYTLGRLPGDSTGPDPDAHVSPDSSIFHDSGISPPPDAEGPHCHTQRQEAVRKGLNLLLMVENSLVMTLQQLLWDNITASIAEFVDDPANAGVGVGILYYPRDSCTAEDYTRPEVPIAPLPEPAQQIKMFPLPGASATDMLAPALQGALDHLRSVADQTPDRDTHLILLSAGTFDLCGSEHEPGFHAETAYEGTPSIKTYVLELEIALSPGISPLDRVAAAGGTSQSLRIPVSQRRAHLAAALEQVRSDALPCAFRIPSNFDAARTSLRWQTSPDAALEAWPTLPLEQCGEAHAAFTDTTNPSYLHLCPAACAALRAHPEGRVSVEEACAP